MGDELNKAGEACAARALSNCPISWVKHEAANAGNPYLNQLISVGGMESYGRYWRLIELLSNTKANRAIGAFSLVCASTPPRNTKPLSQR